MTSTVTVGRDADYSHAWVEVVPPKAYLVPGIPVIVTHTYQKTGIAPHNVGRVTDRWRIALVISPVADVDALWTYELSYSVQQAVRPGDPVEPWWCARGRYGTHAEAMAYLEDRARFLGWLG